MKKSQKGFTLIELLVVIAIIGILSSVVLASLNSARRKSRDARRLADLQQIKLASELYFDANRTYPAALADIAPDFIASVPQDPLGGGYEYAASGTPATDYCLGAVLEDANSVSTSSSNAACEASLGNDVNFAVAP
ncbi:MAG TPA: prepilin-type N-terminal cleavage/methylation domain-containing protein [Candidatus Paceibacterota bacterium]|nr:prepilin-type N-terminal cleavage/methylation domain-containing protein [Candidatus Paceibacterota bacterium]